jgi:hypothetical protein
MRRSGHRPSLAIKAIDSKRALKGFRSPQKVDEIDRIPAGAETPEPKEGYFHRGHFLDLRTLVFALTDRSHSLESASRAFGVPYEKRGVEQGSIRPENIDYCREDVEATGRLLEASTREFLAHPIELQATRAYSPATIGKGYLKKMGVRPILERQDFDPRLLGWAMSAYYGGRAECRIRRVPVPVVYCDFLSMYPTVCGLMELWQLLTARELEVDDQAADEVTRLLEDASADEFLKPDRWPELVGIAQVLPAEDVLPVRARYGPSPSWQIGLNYLSSSEPLWYPIADLVASKILTGKAPRIVRAIRVRPCGDQLPTLEPVALLGKTQVDPSKQDFFRTIVEERHRTERQAGLPDAEREWRAQGLKVLANATSYGIYAQMTRHERAAGHKENVTVYGRADDPHNWSTPSPEDPGEFSFPPLAASITGGARLMLALLERLVTDCGGTYAFCDTDSMAIVASEEGGFLPCPGGTSGSIAGGDAIRALSWAEVDDLRERFEALKPYDRDTVVAPILELEDENFAEPKTRLGGRRELWCYGISAKRYVLYQRSDSREPVLRGWPDLDAGIDAGDSEAPPDQLLKPSEHGLGHLLNPTDPESEDRGWIQQAWAYLLRSESGDAEEPDWLDRPAVAQSTVSSPRLRKLFQSLNRDRPYAEQIKPFNFLNIAFVPAQERPASEQRMVLVAPYERDPRRWLEMPWFNRYSGREYRLTLEPFNGYVRPGVVRPRSYRDILRQYRTNEEVKSLGPEGQPCGQETRGLLGRRHVRLRTVTHVGKESNSLEDAQTGLVQDLDETLNEYDDFYTTVFASSVIPILKDLGVRETARRTKLSVGAVSAVLSGSSRPRDKNASIYLAVAEAEARKRLTNRTAEDPFSSPRDELDFDDACLRLATRQAGGPLACSSSGIPSEGGFTLGNRGPDRS